MRGTLIAFATLGWLLPNGRAQAKAPLRFTERIGVPALLGDQAGITRMKRIAACFEQILQLSTCAWPMIRDLFAGQC